MRVRRLAVLLTLAVAVLVPAVALATTYIYEGKGVGATRLGWNDHTAATRLSSTHKYFKDTAYSYTVYHWYVGRKMSNGRYPIELYSKSDHRVYRYQVNSGSYPTTKGVKVGSYESTLRSKYSTEKGPFTSGLYRRYYIKHSIFSYYTYTEFYCKNGKVAFIVVRK